MALSRDVYRELEDILGTEKVSEDPSVMETYSFHGTMTAMSPGRAGRYASHQPEAVVLPACTQEVQKVIKLCNRRGLKVRAFGTGYGRAATVECENAILIDLRRMNRILEIDEKNMYIVVEPYVSFAQVQAEANKRGMNCHVISAGSQPSFLASMTSVQGTNAQAASHGWSGRNLFGVEWVLPSGEVLRLGSPGSGAGWFTGDGPGPSLRGIMRGSAGASGGLGVFTKCAAHLHPWPAMKPMEVKGVSPYYEAVVPPLHEYKLIEWPSWDQCADAQYRMGEEGIVMAMHKTGGPGTHGSVVTTSNNEFWEQRQVRDDWILPWVSYAVVTAANTPAEHAYQMKTLNKIVEDTGGSFIALQDDPVWKSRDYMNMLKMCFVPRSAFRLGGAFACPLQAMENIGHITMGLAIDKDFRKKYDEKGLLGDDGTNNMWSVPFEGGHWAIFECGHNYDPTDEASFNSMLAMMDEGEEIGFKVPLGPFLRGSGHEGANKFGPFRYNYHEWMRRIKKGFDPNTAFDPTNYIWPDRE